MKAIPGVFIVLLVSLSVWAQPPPPTAPAPAKSKAPPNYYPLKVGAKWHYQLEVGNSPKGGMVNQIVKIENIDGKDLALLQTVVQGELKGSEHLSTNEQGVFRNRYNGAEVSPPVCLLKYPVKDGTSWEAQTRIGEQQFTITGREGPSEEVQVPAGRFQTVTAIVQTTVNGQTIRTSYWFAENVGMVKQMMELGGQLITLQLLKYQEPK